MKNDEENLIYRWCFYLKTILKGLNAKSMPVKDLFNFAIVMPESKMLCPTVEEAIIYAEKAINSIKADEYAFLKYRASDDSIEQVESWD